MTIVFAIKEPYVDPTHLMCGSFLKKLLELAKHFMFNQAFNLA
jgi:hypothetical protein